MIVSQAYTPMTPLKHFMAVYQNLRYDNIDSLRAVYAENVHFTDPIKEIFGIDNLCAYIKHLYTNLVYCEFEFIECIEQQDSVCLVWRTNYQHRRIDNSKQQTLTGCSVIHIDKSGAICYHRDFFDLGAMLYQHIPVIGKLILAAKKRVAAL